MTTIPQPEFNIPPDILLFHIEQFDRSLKFYPDKYFPLFFSSSINVPDHVGYVCPLCLTSGFLIDREGKLHFNSEFSLDHFPPESVGGTLKILVCKKCNNEAGHQYDFSLKQKLEHVSFNKRIPFSTIGLKSEITNVSGWYRGEMSIRENGETEVSFKPNPKKKIKPLDDWIENSKTDNNWKANMTISIPDETKISKALLKIAYLYCFVNFGYEFIYSANGEFFRKVLSGEESYPIKLPDLWLDHELKLPDGVSLPKGLCFIQKPLDWQSLVINVNLSLKDNGYNCVVPVLIPSPEDQDFKKLIQIADKIAKGDGQEITFMPVGNFLHEKIYNAYTETWSSMTKAYSI